MDDFTQLSRPRPIMPPSHSVTFEEFLKEFEGHHAEWLPDGTVEILPDESITPVQLRLDLGELLGVYLQVTGWGHLLTTFLQRTSEALPVREPDMLVVSSANLEQILHRYLAGPADIAVEIVSPESVARDYGTKFREYELGGVREYWLIDPDRHIADSYELGENGLYQRRPIDAKGRLTSGVLTQFAFDLSLIWANVTPTSAENLHLVAEMLGVPVESLLK